MAQAILKFHNLGKQFGYYKAVRGASGQILPGDFISLFGENGAGKSTLLNILSGIYKPDQGNIEFGQTDKEKFYASMQLMSHQSMFYNRLSAQENLNFFQGLYQKPDRDQINFALELTGLFEKRNQYIDGFSRGMIQRLMIARMMIARPEIVFFDEPFTGLDIRGQNLLYSIMQERGIANLGWKINCFVFVDHDVKRAYEFAQTIWHIRSGELGIPCLKKDLSLPELEEMLS